MRSKGKITHWNDDKGYGFIQPATGAEKVFVHIRAFGPHVERPSLDEKVTFSLSTDKQGRPCAVKVARAGEKPPGRVRNDNYSGHVLIAIAFMAVVGMSVYMAGIPIQVFYLYLVVSIITFVVYAIDKSAARRGTSRTPEKTLHLLALVGGWPGAMIAQQTLRHKSSKRSFRAVFWVTVVLNCGVFIWLLTPDGGAMLRSVIDEVARVAWDSGNR